ncbi:hypothetical protein [Gordonia sp. N1V]|uniref:hypothetical protein n=1 Tax=Gordonia sp. N1V TaxID=3034163 RepID=UPI0023E30E96|nr:hypothetical protein [Gordonia sp. N1V]MDF3280603.1 hypothetical protein [Gordonia sp. N1V]
MTAVTAVIAVGVVIAGFADSTQRGLGVLGPMILLCGVVWLVLGNPHVAVDRWAVYVVNPLRRYRVPFAALRDVRTRWSLTLVTDVDEIVAWSATAPGGRSSLTGRDERRTTPRLGSVPVSAIRADGTIGPGDLAGTDSGDAASRIRRRWETARVSGALDDVPTSSVVVRWNTIPIGLFLFGVLMTLFSVVW